MRRTTLLALLLGCGLAVSGLFLLRFLQNFEASGAWTPGTSLSWWAVPLAVGLQVLAHALRALNAQRLLSAVRPASVTTLFSGLSIGFLFNAVLPFRLGELVRAQVTGKEMSISRSVVLLTVLFERAVDGVLLGLCALGLWALYGGTAPERLGALPRLAGAVSVVAVLVAGLVYVLYSQQRWLLRWVRRVTALFNDGIRDRLRFVSWSVIYGMHVIFRGAPLGRYLATACGMWMLYLASMLVLVHDFVPGSSPWAKLAVAVSAYLSVSVPSGPGFVGTYHYYFSELARGLLGMNGVPLGLSLLSWSVLIVPFTLVGLGLLLFRRRGPLALEEREHLDPVRNKLHRDQDVSREFSHFLDEYFSGEAISHVLSTREIRGEFRMVKTFKGGSNASTLLVWEEEQLRVKKVTLPQYAQKLRAQYEWLRHYSHLKHLPKPVREAHGSDCYSFDLEFREQYIPFFLFLHSEGLERSCEVVDGVLDFMFSHIYELGELTEQRGELEAYLREKVVEKARDAAALGPALSALVEAPELIINGRLYEGFYPALERLRANAQALRELASVYRTPIHGDLTVDNIIVSRNDGDFLVLDPNNENAISDPVVDCGKLYQSLHSGYEFLCQLTQVRVRGTAIEYEDNLSARYAELFEHLRRRLAERLPPERLRAVLFHEAVHYCRMLTYRARINPVTLPAFFATAVKLFNEFNAQYQQLGGAEVLGSIQPPARSGELRRSA
jgi:hypothetical protein